MKKISKIGLVLLLALSLTGCMKVNVDFKIDRKGAMTGTAEYLISDSLVSMAGEEFVQAEGENEEVIQRDGYTGIKMVLAAEDFSNLQEYIHIQDNKMSINIPINMQDFSVDELGVDGMDVSQLKQMGVEMMFRFTVEGKILEHNGTSIEENTVIYDLLEFKGDTIHVEVNLMNNGYVFVMAFFAIGTALIVLIVIQMVRKQREKAEKEAQEKEEALAEASVEEEPANETTAEEETMETVIEEVAEEVEETLAEEQGQEEVIEEVSSEETEEKKNEE